MPAKDESIEFRCATAEKLMFEEAAEKDGMKLSSWFRALGHERATRVLLGDVDESVTAFQPGFGLNEED